MNWGQIWLGLGPALLAAGIAYMGLRQSNRKDTEAVRSGMLSNHRATTGQAIEVLNLLIDQLQEENANCQGRLNVSITERDACRLELARLRRKYGNGDDTPNPPNK